jgi:UDP-N-acetyl-D-galactosamine dehydrogenase
MGKFIANKVIKLMIQKGLRVNSSNILILGITFKENCPDLRNSKVIDVIKELEEFGANVDVYDPLADKEDVKHEYGLETLNDLRDFGYEAVIHAVAHQEFLKLNIQNLVIPNGVIYDVKSTLPKNVVDGRL